MSDSFEDAVAGTQSGSSTGSEIVREKIVYPTAPPGLYRAMCVSSEEKEFKGFKSEDMELKYSLRFELRLNILTNAPAGYKGGDDKNHFYSVWGKPLTRNFADGKKSGKPSNLYKLFKELFGIPPPYTKKEEMRNFGGNVNKLVEIMTFNHKLFEYAEVIIKVGEKVLDDGRTVNTCEYEGFSCDNDMKLRNYMQLPPEVRAQYPFPGGQPQAVPSAPSGASAGSSPAGAPTAASEPSVTPAEATAIMEAKDPMETMKAEQDEKIKAIPF